MSCYRPITAWRSERRSPDTGKRQIVFNRDDCSSSGRSEQIKLPCGRCVGCRTDYSRQWAVRCIHEASLHKSNCFITLTFNDDFVSDTLCKRDFVLFMKRLRKRFGKGVRFFHCGEYGSDFQRPHHHACLFGIDFPDKYLWTIKNGVNLYRSAILEELWPYGFCTVGDVTFKSAAYVARYISKKINGEERELHYAGRVPEYVTMSRGGRNGHGLASDWFDRFSTDIFPNDFVVLSGVKCKVPKYYDKQLNLTDPDLHDILVSKRVKLARANPDNSVDRLRQRELVHKATVAKLVREYEN
ncbi:MAG: replication initiator protein [Arizlama microvirus]|nr:MAG: replication initiator protein [Arizlama microvirus]